MIRWSLTFFCIVMMVVNGLVGLSTWGECPLSSSMAFLAIFFIFALCIAAVWGSWSAKRVLAGLLGLAILYAAVNELFFSAEPFFSTKRFTNQNPLQVLILLPMLGVPCLLYAIGANKLLERYQLTGCLLFVVFLVITAIHGCAALFDLLGWAHAAAYLPLAVLLIAWGLHSLWCEFRDRRQGWRIGRGEYTSYTYEERIAGQWAVMTLPCISDFRESPVQYAIPEKKAWRSFPTWTEERHALILDRIRTSISSRDVVLIDAESNWALPDG